jgi:TnpA family transposase
MSTVTHPLQEDNHDYRSFFPLLSDGQRAMYASEASSTKIYQRRLPCVKTTTSLDKYGGYGGIGYYHVSDNYIARFSHFIPCGVWEGSFILDIFEQEDKEPKPETLHGDTQAQSSTIFGMAYLLGIALMPRIRNWKDLNLFRPSPDAHYTHIETLFSDTVDWNVIETHLPDMLRVVLSVKAGTIRPSTILRKLGTYSRRNKLYQAFRELGDVVRTEFLLHLLGDPDLRSMLQSAMNKSEAFNVMYNQKSTPFDPFSSSDFWVTASAMASALCLALPCKEPPYQCC